MAWLDGYLPASFRGVPFGVDGHELDGGRRVQGHQYPGRDEPYNEDLGRRAKQFTIDAYIVGDNYMLARDALVAACDRAGAGTLVHPYFGVRRVSCSRYRVSERTSEGRMCQVQLTFAEAGQNRYPTSVADLQAVASSAAASARTALFERFSREFSL